MRRYIKLLQSYFMMSLMADLQYRANIGLKIFNDFIWYMGNIALFEVLFHHAPQISGWTLPSTRFFLGYLFMTDAIYMVLFHENLEKFSEKVRRGDLDLQFAKPIDSQFSMSLQKMNPFYLVNFIVVLLWMLQGGLGLRSFLLLMALVPASTLIIYSLRFCFTCTSLFLVRAENLTYLWYQFYRLGTRPDSLFPGWLRNIIRFCIPVALIASVPVQIILERLNIYWVATCWFASLASFAFSRYLWKWGVRKYTSASS